MTEPTDPAALSDEVATAIAWLRDHAATDDFGRDFSRNKRHGAIADLLTRLSARVTEAERERDEAREQRDAALKVQNWVDNNSDRAIAAERRLETARAALEAIAGLRGWPDNLMGNSDIARVTLAALQPQDAPTAKDTEPHG